MIHTSYISFGSNLGDREGYILSALQRINNLPKTEIILTSNLYSSTPWGFSSENEFLNGVFLIETAMGVGSLLSVLQRIEGELGREAKTVHGYSDRVIDLDILSYDHLVLSLPSLTIPHPLLHVRNFVLEPLAEIAPEWVHPLYLETPKTLLSRSPDKSQVHKKNAL